MHEQAGGGGGKGERELGHAGVHLKPVVNIISRMHGGEIVNALKVNPNSLLTEIEKSNLDIS